MTLCQNIFNEYYDVLFTTWWHAIKLSIWHLVLTASQRRVINLCWKSIVCFILQILFHKITDGASGSDATSSAHFHDTLSATGRKFSLTKNSIWNTKKQPKQGRQPLFKSKSTFFGINSYKDSNYGAIPQWQWRISSNHLFPLQFFSNIQGRKPQL